MIGKIILVMYVTSEMILSYIGYKRKKKIVLGIHHPFTKGISLIISALIWWTIMVYW